MRLIQGDCLKIMPTLEAGSVDLILCDLPYGTTACQWDSVIPFGPLWENYNRLIHHGGAIVLTASQPFTSALVMSNPAMFRYSWVWEKPKAPNFLDARRRPLKAHEDVLVFGKTAPRYFPQKTPGSPYAGRRTGSAQTEMVGVVANPMFRNDNDGDRYPRSVQYVNTAKDEGKLHPTQKPVALMEYLIRTYTLEGDTVLDNCMGSGSTGVACVNTGREFVGIEQDDVYFAIAQKRLAQRAA